MFALLGPTKAGSQKVDGASKMQRTMAAISNLGNPEAEKGGCGSLLKKQ